jgi:hypothetical protein
MREESLLVYCVGSRDLRHRCQYFVCSWTSSFESSISSTIDKRFEFVAAMEALAVRPGQVPKTPPLDLAPNLKRAGVDRWTLKTTPERENVFQLSTLYCLQKHGQRTAHARAAGRHDTSVIAVLTTKDDGSLSRISSRTKPQQMPRWPSFPPQRLSHPSHFSTLP